MINSLHSSSFINPSQLIPIQSVSMKHLTVSFPSHSFLSFQSLFCRIRTMQTSDSTAVWKSATWKCFIQLIQLCHVRKTPEEKKDLLRCVVATASDEVDSSLLVQKSDLRRFHFPPDGTE